MSSTWRHEPHSMKGKICSWAYCLHCGLVALNNDLTRWCISKGCNASEHPSYKSMLDKTAIAVAKVR